MYNSLLTAKLDSIATWFLAIQMKIRVKSCSLTSTTQTASASFKFSLSELVHIQIGMKFREKLF